MFTETGSKPQKSQKEDEQKFRFEHLDIYRKSVDFAADFFDVFNEMPAHIQYTIGRDTLSAVMNIACQIAEANETYGDSEKMRAFDKAQSAICTCIPPLSLLVDKNIMARKMYDTLYDEALSMKKMLSKLSAYFYKAAKEKYQQKNKTQ